MKFYKKDIKGKPLAGIIWNPNTNREWCNFGRGGVVETDDPQLIEVLLKYGYLHDEVKVEEVKVEEIVEVEEVIEEVAREEISENFFVDSGSIDETIDTEAPTPKYKTKSELNKALKGMDKIELEAYALEEFGVELDRRHSWAALRKEIYALGEKALEN